MHPERRFIFTLLILCFSITAARARQTTQPATSSEREFAQMIAAEIADAARLRTVNAPTIADVVSIRIADDMIIARALVGARARKCALSCLISTASCA